jgi:hypothetical protein
MLILIILGTRVIKGATDISALLLSLGLVAILQTAFGHFAPGGGFALPGLQTYELVIP